MRELRRILAYVSVLVGAIFLAGGALISLAICLHLKDAGLSAQYATVFQSQMTDPILIEGLAPRGRIRDLAPPVPTTPPQAFRAPLFR